MNKLPSLSGSNKPFIFDRISNTHEHWILSYFFTHEEELGKGISISNKLSKLEEILSLPKGYHDALRSYTSAFNNGFSKFLLEKYRKESYIQKLFTHPIEKIRTTNEGIDYVSFIGLGVYYLPVEISLQDKGSVFIDKQHPFVLVAPDKTIYKYWGMSGMPSQMLCDENDKRPKLE
jgi:hypothetical protein